MKRKSGVLLPVFSLPSRYGAGNFGPGAYYFVDFLSDSGFTVWQILPLCPTDDFHSPYMSCASFAGNTDYISLELLTEGGLLTEEECEPFLQTNPYSCEWPLLGEKRKTLLRKAYERSDKKEAERFFSDSPEIVKAARFLALRRKNCLRPFTEWTDSVPNAEEFGFELFLQYLFYKQWEKLKAYANSKGIEIWGDLPFYVSPDSSDVYNNKGSFKLKKDGSPAFVAGVPPDYFAKDGQFWGNPVYDWKKVEEEGYAFIKQRIKHALSLYDGVRLDHFRAFSEYWEIPSSFDSARYGSWIEGPGRKCIDVIKECAGDREIIAENLGIIDKKTDELLEYSGFPGMAVFQFGFDGKNENCHLPHNYKENTVAYTGTHDNNTLLGFMWEIDENTRKNVLDYVGFKSYDWGQSYESIIRVLMMSKASTVIFPIQDLLGFGGDTRFNTPGQAKGNWSFRVTLENLNSIDRKKWRKMNSTYSRI